MDTGMMAEMTTTPYHRYGHVRVMENGADVSTGSDMRNSDFLLHTNVKHLHCRAFFILDSDKSVPA